MNTDRNKFTPFKRLLYFYTVKKKLKLFMPLGLLLLYYFTQSFYSSSPVNYSVDFSKKTNSEFNISKGFTDLFIRSEQTETGIGLHRNNLRTSFKNQVNHFSSCSLTSPFIVISGSSLYSFYSNRTLINFKNTDVIFPSHYFW